MHGTYAYKTARKRWVDNEECIPTRMLYLNLKEAISIDCDSQKEFDFRFLSEPEFEELKTCPDAYFWFKVGDILDLEQKMLQCLLSTIYSHKLTGKIESPSYKDEENKKT